MNFAMREVGHVKPLLLPLGPWFTVGISEAKRLFQKKVQPRKWHQPENPATTKAEKGPAKDNSSVTFKSFTL